MRTSIYYNKITFSTICTLVALLTSSACWSNTYYVDVTGGNNSNAGTATDNAWETISKVNTSTFSPGDSILFKRGEIWREQLTVPSAGSAGNVITFGAYGIGNSPIVTGFDIITPGTSWSGNTNNVWIASVTTEPKVVLFNGTRGTNAANVASVNGSNKWFWNGNVLYVYSTSEPDTAFTSPGIEASRRDYGILQQKSYITIQDLDVSGANAHGGIFNWTNTGATSNITIQRNTVHHNATAGIRVANAHVSGKTTTVVIDNNTVYENGTTGIETGNGVNTVRISNNIVHNNTWSTADYQAGIRHFGNQVDGSGIVIEKNDVYGNYYSGALWSKGNGIHVDEVAGSPGPIIRYNKVHDNGQLGIFVEHTKSGAQVYYNLSYGNNAGSLGGIGIMIFRGCDGVTVYNNVSYGNNVGLGSIGETSGDPYQNNIFKNNIATGNNTQLWVYAGAANDNKLGSGNVYIRNALGVEGANFIKWGASSISTYSEWETTYGGTTHSVQTDPLFISTITPDFHLQSSSPAIDVGANVSLITDYDGRPVPFGSVPDIGAFEYQVTSNNPSSPRILNIK